MHKVYIALGSNLGNRRENLSRAVQALRSSVRVQQVSSLYETEPWGVTNQPWFYNAVLSGETELNPNEVLRTLKTIEKEMGRGETIRYGPRPIDLDLLLYDDLELESADLTIPHPRLHERAFVLRPLAEIAPALVHPRLGLTPAQMLAQMPNPGETRYLGPFI